MMLGKFHAVDVLLWGEIGRTLASLADRVPAADRPAQRESIAKQWARWRTEKHARSLLADGRGRMHPAHVFLELSELAPENAVIAVDVGNNTYSFGRYFECKHQSVLMSGYLGSIGFGYPAAIGAWAAAPDRPIVAVTGDGGFGQYLAELNTAVKYDIPITHVLLNNRMLGKIAKEQRAAEWDVWQTSLHNPNFAEYARICGAHGIRVEAARDLADALGAAFAHDGPALVEVMTDADLV